MTADKLAADSARVKADEEDARRRAAGAAAQTVYRDAATGRVVSAEEFAASRARQKAGGKPQYEEVHLEWKRGLAQQRERDAARAAAAREAGKAFGRGFDDDADAAFRERSRWGDPMAGRVRGKRGGEDADLAAPPPVVDASNRAAFEASGFSVPQDVPAHSWLKRGAAPPLNRYNIKPGRHWDGVDRSNGFERRMFKERNERAAREAEARAWAQSDM